MSDSETIAVADVSAGVGGAPDADPGTTVELPAVELLTGRGFVTGKSGSGKSNTASVIIENLLSNNFPVMIVDTDGEYYGLKEAFEILHAGADDECDIQVSPEHAERLASLALEQNVPIILDVSGYLDEDVAQELLLETTRHLFAKEKKLKKPFLMLVEEVHEYIPEGGGLGEAGKMLIKVGKRGRKHGLGIVGISQRPADVKKDFITQCDWLVWHRLTWGNDTKVVGRILGSEYSTAIEEMDDGEGFLVTDWSEHVRRVQFHRKETFDAGATPGLEDFERPELKSVSGDLVDELRTISDEQERKESRLADLRQELDKKEQRIAELERELSEARDMRQMADQFAQALLGRAEAPYRGGGGRNMNRPHERQRALREYEAPADGPATADAGDGGAETADAEVADAEAADARTAAEGSTARTADAGGIGATDAAGSDGGDAADAAAAFGGLFGAADGGTEGAANGESAPSGVNGEAAHPNAVVWATDGGSGGGAAAAATATYPGFAAVDGAIDTSLSRDDAVLAVDGGVTREAVEEAVTAILDALGDVSRGMLAHYRDRGASTPLDAHVAGGGDRDRGAAYGRNRPLRVAGFVRHAGRDRYAYALPETLRDAFGDALTTTELDSIRGAVEERF